MEAAKSHKLSKPVRLRALHPFSRGIAQSGKASGLGPEDRGFESLCPEFYGPLVYGLTQRPVKAQKRVRGPAWSAILYAQVD